jgi:NTP pyrophosphatase (non-canonical NTP hydrolase)
LYNIIKLKSQQGEVMSDLKQYVQDAIRTESKIETVQTDYNNLLAVMELFVAAGNLLDDFKKNIFYGKPINQEKWESNLDVLDVIPEQISPDVDDIERHKSPLEIDPRLLHALIGIATESTELVEAIIKALKSNTDIDHVNVLEELGDIFWYTAIAIDTTGADWNSILDTNIAKLKARYPEKFTTEAAITRDLDGERKILEREKFQVRTTYQVLENIQDY